MESDIVARLREEGFVTHMARLPRESKLLHEAADEIERLREMLRLEREESAACAIDRRETQRERDEARREVCEWVAMMTKRKPSTAAKERGWNCFKENTDEH